MRKCKQCGSTENYHAKGLCRKCYDKLPHSKLRFKRWRDDHVEPRSESHKDWRHGKGRVLYLEGRRKRGKEERERNKFKIKARKMVSNLIRYDKFPKPCNFKCVGCGVVAEEYHHPDYRFGLLVVPVCGNCNKKYD